MNDSLLKPNSDKQDPKNMQTALQKLQNLLQQLFRTYTRRNTADFFIHKNLNQFLTHELDTYIKNEVIPLSNLILTNVNSELTISTPPL